MKEGVRKDGADRRHAHAILVFDEPVQGPAADRGGAAAGIRSLRADGR